jgi:DtxR family Mn-dependent transcriptional regulator
MKTISFTEENYLKHIYALSGQQNKKVLTSYLADSIQTKAATVSDMLSKLSSKKLVEYEKYYGVRLTEKGKSIALNIIRKHRIWEVFLVAKLNFSWDEVHQMAEELEHATSDELSNRLEHYLGNPKSDPHGDPIPNKKGEIEKINSTPLHQAKAGSQWILKAVADEDSHLLKYLQKNKLLPGSKIMVKEKNEFDGSFDILINNKYAAHISQQVAQNLMVLFLK